MVAWPTDQPTPSPRPSRSRTTNIDRKLQVAPIAAVISAVKPIAGSRIARRPRLSDSQPPIQLLKAQVIEVPEISSPACQRAM